MRYAIYNGQRVEGISGAIGRCECCDAEVQGCDGEFYRYWRHFNREDCDTWAEGETAWHVAWKQRFTSSRSLDEQTLRERGAARGHRADILTPYRVVVELQHSFLSADELRLREDFYGRLANDMVWLFDLTEKSENFDLTPKESHYTFQWKHMRLTSLVCEFPRFVDLGNDRVFEIKKLHKGKAVHGWGKAHTYDGFVQLIERKRWAERNPEQTQIRPSRRERLLKPIVPTPAHPPVTPDRPAPAEPHPIPPAPIPAAPVRPAAPPPASRSAAPQAQPIQPTRQSPPAHRRSWTPMLMLFVVVMALALLLCAAWLAFGS